MSVLALLAATALSSPAEQSPRDAVRVTALEGGRIGLQQGNLRSTLNVAASINGCTGQVYDGWSGDKYGLGFGLRVIDQVKKGNHWYLVLQTDSNPNCNIQGMCGAASNIDLIWLKLDLRLQPLARQTEVLEDCYTNTVLTSVSGQKSNLGQTTILEMRQGVFTATTETDAGKAVQLRYERARPELGLQRR